MNIIESLQNNKIPIICGPTASGKTELSLKIAKEFKELVIVNIDAYQVYKSIPITSASPSEEEKSIVPHELFNYVDHYEHFSVGRYLKELDLTLKKVLDQKKFPLLVGGTNLYVYSLLNGLHVFPETSIEAKLAAKNELIKEGQIKFFDKLKSILPQINISCNDLYRLTRIYEFFIDTGLYLYSKDLPSFKLNYNFELFKIIPENREDIYKKSDSRIDNMIEQGAIDEIKNLIPVWNECKSIKKALLVKELHDFLTNKIDLEEAIQIAKMNSRRFIKKQYSWLKNKL